MIFLIYLQDILNFGCSQSTNLNGSSVNLFEEVRWPKRVNHKSVYQNTKQFPTTQINFPKHKSVYQNTKQFPKAQVSLPKHKTISQNTNQFSKTQISYAKHKSFSQNTSQFRRNTNKKTGHLLCYYQRAWKGLILRIFRVQHGDF